MKTQTLTTSVTLGQEAIERLAAIVAGSDDGIIGKDLNGVITSWNAGAEKIFGYTAQEAMGRRIDFLLPPEHVEEEGFILVKILKGERVSHFQAERVCKGGQRITVSATVSPIFDASGKVVGASKIVRDITQQKKERLALLEANKELLFQIEAKAERAAELVIANEVKAQLEAVNIEKLNRSLMETIGIARQLVELRDPYTAGHEKHVGELAKAMAAESRGRIDRGVLA